MKAATTVCVQEYTNGLLDPKPVSYTHLDVYKRQMLWEIY